MHSTAWVARYAPHAVLPRHAHDAARLCVVLAGRFEEDANGSSRTNGPGWLLYRPAGMPHAERFDRAGAACALIVPGPGWVEAARDSRIALASPISLNAPEVARIGLALRRECADPDDYSALACDAAAWECLALLGRKPRDRQPVPKALGRALDHLRRNPASPIDLAALAAIAGLHPSTLSRHFRRRFGQSIGAYARRMRIERAAALLRETSIPIAEVALICGFSSQAHLTTLMRRALGITPARFRALHRT
jgi:AraC family transcriptional regulator